MLPLCQWWDGIDAVRVLLHTPCRIRVSIAVSDYTLWTVPKQTFVLQDGLHGFGGRFWGWLTYETTEETLDARQSPHPHHVRCIHSVRMR